MLIPKYLCNDFTAENVWNLVKVLLGQEIIAFSVLMNLNLHDNNSLHAIF